MSRGASRIWILSLLLLTSINALQLYVSYSLLFQDDSASNALTGSECTCNKSANASPKTRRQITSKRKNYNAQPVTSPPEDSEALDRITGALAARIQQLNCKDYFKYLDPAAVNSEHLRLKEERAYKLRKLNLDNLDFILTQQYGAQPEEIETINAISEHYFATLDKYFEIRGKSDERAALGHELRRLKKKRREAIGAIVTEGNVNDVLEDALISAVQNDAD